MIKPSKDCSNFFKVMITAGLLFLPTIGSSDVIINNGTSDGCDTINGVMEQGCTPEGEVIPTQTEPNEPTTPTGPGGNTGGDVIIDNGVSDGCDIINGVMEQGCTPEGEVMPTTAAFR